MTVLQVVVGLVYDQSGRVLLSKRIPPSSYPGYWELPGGKIEPGESALEALKRELFEEIGIQVIKAKSLKKIEHTYPDYAVCIEVFNVDQYLGTVKGLENQPVSFYGLQVVDHLLMLPTVRACLQ